MRFFRSIIIFITLSSSSLQLYVCIYCTRVSVCVGVHMCMCGGVWCHGNRHMVMIMCQEEDQSQRWRRFRFEPLFFMYLFIFVSHVHPQQREIYIVWKSSHDLSSSCQMKSCFFTFSRPSDASSPESLSLKDDKRRKSISY